MKNPINECNLFGTPTSYNDLLEWCEQYTGGEKVAAITAMHMALNLAHHIVHNAMNKNDEETGDWVIADYFPNSPTHIYGFFDSEGEARKYADQQGMGRNGSSYDVYMVLNAHYQERREPWE